MFWNGRIAIDGLSGEGWSVTADLRGEMLFFRTRQTRIGSAIFLRV